MNQRGVHSRDYVWAAIIAMALALPLCAEDGAPRQLTAKDVVRELERQMEVLGKWEIRWRRVLDRAPNPGIAARMAERRQVLELQTPRDEFERARHEMEIRQARALEAHFLQAKTEESTWLLRLTSLTNFYGAKYRHRPEEGGDTLVTEYTCNDQDGYVENYVELGSIQRGEKSNVFFNTLRCGPLTVLYQAKLIRERTPAAAYAWSLEDVAENESSLILTQDGKPALKARFAMPSFLCTRIATVSPGGSEVVIHSVPAGTAVVQKFPFLPAISEAKFGASKTVWHFHGAELVGAKDTRKVSE